MLKFYWNGIKDNGGKLQTCHYSAGQLTNHTAGTLTIYKREYSAFSAGVQSAFAVNDDTDIVTDYITKEYIRVVPGHPLYAEVLKAHQAQVEHHAKQASKQAARCLELHAH